MMVSVKRSLFLFNILAVLCYFSCSRTNGKTDSIQFQPCNSDRPVVSETSNVQGVIKLLNDIAIIVTSDTQYLPCNLPKSLKVSETMVVFSGKVLEIRPNERLAGTPLELSDAKLVGN